MTFNKVTVVITSSFIPARAAHSHGPNTRHSSRHSIANLPFYCHTILNWKTFKMSLILIMLCHNVTLTVVQDSGSQISKIDES